MFVYLKEFQCVNSSSGYVTGTGVRRFPKIEIWRKPQKNVQINFIKRMLEHSKGDSTEEKNLALRTDSGAGSAWLLL